MSAVAMVRPAADLESAVERVVAAILPWLSRVEAEELVRNVIHRGATQLEVFTSAVRAIRHRNRHGWLKVHDDDVITVARMIGHAWGKA